MGTGIFLGELREAVFFSDLAAFMPSPYLRLNALASPAVLVSMYRNILDKAGLFAKNR
jgi:hypothetical protein